MGEEGVWDLGKSDSKRCRGVTLSMDELMS